MPELPEVETIKSGLEKKIVGKAITDIILDREKSIIGNVKDVLNTKVTKLERRAKILRICLDNSKNLLFHLKMTGQLIYIDPEAHRLAGGHPSHDWHGTLPNKHTRIEFHFNDGGKLFFNDLRKFGWCKVLTDEQVAENFKKYGPEPFSAGFTAEYLFEAAKRYPNRKIKQFLMDQTIVAGIGNIYNDELLFLAKIMPTTIVSKLKINDWQKIASSVKKVLTLAIQYGGTTDSDYVDSEGKKGGMQDHLNVYHRSNLFCNNSCGGKVKRTTLGGRGTFYCPSCQKEIK